MKMNLALLSSLLATLSFGCASVGDSKSNPSETAIYDKCMRVEIDVAMKGAGGEAPMTREDAREFSHYVCKVTSGICAKDATAQGCEENLKRYGFGQ